MYTILDTKKGRKKEQMSGKKKENLRVLSEEERILLAQSELLEASKNLSAFNVGTKVGTKGKKVGTDITSDNPATDEASLKEYAELEAKQRHEQELMKARERYKSVDGPIIYGYARVSTEGQAREGNSLIDQSRTLRAHGAQYIYSDHFTGTRVDRPELDLLMQIVQPGDTVLVTKLDRIARTVLGGIEIIDDLTDKGVTVNILNLGVFNNTPTGKLIRTIMLAIAEFEHDTIIERTQAGKAIAREKNPNYREGRPPRLKELEKKIHSVNQLLRKGYELEAACSEIGISRAWYYKLRRKYMDKDPNYFDKEGLAGLKNVRRRGKNYYSTSGIPPVPQTASEARQERIAKEYMRNFASTTPDEIRRLDEMARKLGVKPQG